MQIKLAIIGATGLVGRELLHTIEHSHHAPARVGLYASASSAGITFSMHNHAVEVRDLAQCDFAQYDAAFFCVGDELSANFTPQALAAGCAVVDKSNTFRLDPQVPLLVPHVNDAMLDGSRLVANPNCTTIVLVHALAPLKRRFGLKRLWIATYQSISGGGRSAVDELLNQIDRAKISESMLTRPPLDPMAIAYNVIGSIGPVDDAGRCGEENKLIHETRKILGQSDLPVAVHCTRVPVLIGHSLAVSFELEHPATREELEQAWREAPDVRYLERELPTPVSAAQHRQIEVGRLRSEPGLSQGWSCFICGDNLLIGAALNGWRILKLMHERGIVPQVKT